MKIYFILLFFPFLSACYLNAKIGEISDQSAESSLINTSPSSHEGTLTLNSNTLLINQINKNSVNMFGVCSDNSSQIDILIGTVVNTSVECINGNFSANLDFSSFTDATYSIVAKANYSGGLSKESVPVSIIIDLTAPDVSGVILNKVSVFDKLDKSPLISWQGALDSGSGIDEYQIALGSTLGNNDILPWTNIGNHLSFEILGLNLTNSFAYYPSLRAKDKAGNLSLTVAGNSWTVSMPASGVLNSSFGTHWIRGTANDIWNSFNKVLVDSNGRVVVTGQEKNSGDWGNIILHRLLENGSLDTSFNSNGKITINLSPFEYGIGLYLTSNKIVLGGAYTTTENPLVWKFNDDGSTDTSFGTSGWSSINISGENYVRAMTTSLSDGSFYQVGDDYGDTPFIVKFTSTGAADTTFSGDGHLGLSTHTFAYAKDVAIDNNGKIVIVGTVKPEGTGGDDDAVIIWRVNTNGTIDTSFNSVGYKILGVCPRTQNFPDKSQKLYQS